MKVKVIPNVIYAIETISKGLEKVARREGNRRTNRETILTNRIVEIGKNTEKNSGYLKRFAFIQTQVKGPQLTLEWKTCKE